MNRSELAWQWWELRRRVWCYLLHLGLHYADLAMMHRHQRLYWRGIEVAVWARMHLDQLYIGVEE